MGCCVGDARGEGLELVFVLLMLVSVFVWSSGLVLIMWWLSGDMFHGFVVVGWVDGTGGMACSSVHGENTSHKNLDL